MTKLIPMDRNIRLLVTGSRDYADKNTVRDALEAASTLLRRPTQTEPKGTITLVHGAARGLDTIAAEVARSFGWFTEAHPADWDKHGRMAGPIRNRKMVNLGAELTVAFPLGTMTSGESRGTWGCAKDARTASIPTLVVWQNRFFPVDSKVNVTGSISTDFLSTNVARYLPAQKTPTTLGIEIKSLLLPF